ncbi:MULTISPECIES: hypothetical protein [unclassified Nostoc]|uniref:hypothetical protein n=1 Tax=unclassified Nostoc TaxID=2593658 RepID=UPI0026263D35|nr:hypothetical protein [Nostoc sp. S13]MDF5736790.1 hypothetical protein [Nostoc sp. S13]
MTQDKQDLLLELCKPYLLDLSSLIAESLKHDDEPISEILEDRTSAFSAETRHRLSQLSYRERTSVLYEIALWIDSAANKQQPKQTGVNSDP